MVYAVRQYIKGVKGTGTKDLWVGDEIPSRNALFERFGCEGKFVVMERGKGIRGMRKVAEYIGTSIEDSEPLTKSSFSRMDYRPMTHSEWMPKVFAAENSLSVRKEIKLNELTDEELNALWGSMLETPVESDDDHRRFVDDNEKLREEIHRRSKENATDTKSAETDSTDSVVESVSGGMGMGTVVTAGVAGLVAGAVLQEVRWKRRIDEAENRIRRLEEMLDSMSENADTKAAEQRAVANGGGSLATHNVLRAYNARSGF